MLVFHPATRLIAWAGLVVLVQLARGSLLWGFGLFIGALALAFAARRSRMLVSRIRYLLLVSLVLFAFFTPGELALPGLGPASPSFEGLGLALTQGLRLLAVVMLAALLLEYTDEAALVSGMLMLSRPLSLLGMSSERLAVRLLLVFRYVEKSPAGGWKGLIAADVDLKEGGVALRHAALQWQDWMVMGVVVLLGVGGVFW
jgi:energy-coupling factor transporter transmembrane protein EcfT